VFGVYLEKKRRALMKQINRNHRSKSMKKSKQSNEFVPRGGQGESTSLLSASPK